MIRTMMFVFKNCIISPLWFEFWWRNWQFGRDISNGLEPIWLSFWLTDQFYRTSPNKMHNTKGHRKHQKWMKHFQSYFFYLNQIILKDNYSYKAAATDDKTKKRLIKLYYSIFKLYHQITPNSFCEWGSIHQLNH